MGRPPLSYPNAYGVKTRKEPESGATTETHSSTGISSARAELLPCRGCQPAGLVAVRETGVMWANMLRAFQVGKALISDGGPSSWMRPSRVAWAQVTWPACHLMKASAFAVM